MVKIVALLMFSILALYADGAALKTGQTTVYQTGDDGSYQTGTARSYTRDNVNGTVTDTTTGLMWQDNATSATTNWEDANTTCESLSIGAHNDWRLPTMQELKTLVDRSRVNPAINPIFHYVTHTWPSDKYWSSTPFVGGTQAWYVGFHNGGDYPDFLSNSHNVRCVRGASLATATYTRDATTQTVYDSSTSLTWQDDENASMLYTNWSNAINYCENLTLAGKTDWKLPNYNELNSIVDYSKNWPTLDATFQNGANVGYWSSSTSASDASLGWYVAFSNGNGYTENKGGTSFVRCVRSGKITSSTPAVQNQVLTIQSGWQLLGATQDSNATAFDNKCVDFVWKYNNGWAVHVANGQNITIPSNINALTAMHAGEGFWVKGNGTCIVDTNSTATSGGTISGFTADMIVGKTLYVLVVDSYANHDYGRGKFTFDVNGTAEAIFIDGTFTVPYSIVGGKIIISGDHAATLTLSSIKSDRYEYVESGTDEESGEQYATEYAAFYFNESTRDTAYSALPMSIFTTEILSTNPWYVIEYDENETYCNGKFTFTNSYTLTVSYVENNVTQSVSVPYSIVNGNLVTSHDGKTETETLGSWDTNYGFKVTKKAVSSTTGESINIMEKQYFKNRQDAVNFAVGRGGSYNEWGSCLPN